jgi:hypothetical protein
MRQFNVVRDGIELSSHDVARLLADGAAGTRASLPFDLAGGSRKQAPAHSAPAR